MINEDLFLKWGTARMGNPLVKGEQIRFNSPFCEDNKHHLYCNLHKFWKGVFNCFKSNNKGTVVSLVMKVDNCSYDSALQVLGIKKSSELDFSTFDEKTIDFNDFNKEEFETIVFPDGVVPIQEAPNWWREKAIDYIEKRHLNYNAFYLGISGRMKSRIIIPYHDRKGNLIYYNGRALFNNNLRYLGPPKEEYDVGKSDVMYFANWFKENQKIYICEGEFDSMSLVKSNFVAGAVGGKHISIKQAAILANKKVCLAFDNDESGRSAVENSFKVLKSFGCEVTKVSPPLDIKDWNEFLVKHEKDVLNLYVNRAEENIEE